LQTVELREQVGCGLAFRFSALIVANDFYTVVLLQIYYLFTVVLLQIFIIYTVVLLQICYLCTVVLLQIYD